MNISSSFAGYPRHQAPARTENIRFMLSLDAEKAKRHRMALQIIQPHIRNLYPVTDGDTLHVDYAVKLEYFGDVVQKLDALVEILEDDDIVLGGDLEELLHGRSILLDVLEKMTDIIDREVDR